MNTTAAAVEAHVTVDTVRTWCRLGVVAAVKQAGQWIIDTASLAARIAIGRMKRPARRVVFTAESMTAIGGRRWQKNGMDRVYLNEGVWAELAGIDVSRYGTGNVSSASVNGRGIANGRALGLLGAIDKVWFDAADGLLHFRHYGADVYEIRYLDGERNYLNLLDLVTRGARAAVAAL
ncbi:hypothetical protein HY68_36560 [Streptomyces sp. AcH 505]|uniref:hypothetical protein n=1 Tax=Streptomyces sp. AcH 505 TaxID=352211 RepID=UPI000591CFBE|nr:hypothetical protein HY68_36560 [Streptomyces sp. AcH 505]